MPRSRRLASNLRIKHGVAPTPSPPQTPIAAVSSVFIQKLGGDSFPPESPHRSPMAHRSPDIQPVGDGPHFSYRPKSLRADNPSPRSSGDSAGDSDLESALGSHHGGGHPRSSSSEGPHRSPTQPTLPVQAERVVEATTLIIEEMSDFDSSEDEDLDVILPHTIEYADSERSQSRSRKHGDLDRRAMFDEFKNLNCSNEPSDQSDASDIDENELQELIIRHRLEKRKKRMSSGSIGKRTISESIGSDSDKEDLRFFLDVTEVGSSARRLRRRMDNRRSLQFQDPPPERIEELEEPDSSDEEIEDGETLARELPYYTIEYIMEVDSP